MVIQVWRYVIYSRHWVQVCVKKHKFKEVIFIAQSTLYYIVFHPRNHYRMILDMSRE
jgi:hypothetical protein